MRLIDADALLEMPLECPVNRGSVAKASTIDTAPIKQAMWTMDTDPDDGDCRCSNCHMCVDALHRKNHESLKLPGYKLHTFYRFCPNCGAEMVDSDEK